MIPSAILCSLYRNKTLIQEGPVSLAHLKQWLASRCPLRYYFFLALVVILFSGANILCNCGRGHYKMAFKVFLYSVSKWKAIYGTIGTAGSHNEVSLDKKK